MSNQKAYLISGTVFVALAASLLLVSLKVDMARFDTDILFLSSLLFSIALITVVVFQSFRISQDAAGLADRLVRSILVTSQELFSELYRSSPIPYILIEKNGKVISTNMSAVRLFNINEGELDGQDIFELIEGDEPQRVALIAEKLKAGLFVSDQEVRVKRRDGGVRWTLCSLFSFKDPEGVRRGLLTLVDISKQKQIDQAKTEFVSLASHQLRTPIATMKWNIELLLMKHGAELSPAHKEFIDKAMASLVQMNLLLGDFLNASRFELGTLKYEKVELDLSQFIEGVLAQHSGTVEQKHIAVSTHFDGGVKVIQSDLRLLQMIVNNLISNALKYTPANGSVKVETALTGGACTITVVDSGMGIPKDEQDRLFTKIFRASNASASIPDGTGLGLYIADQAAKVLKGKIECVSEQNKGAAFTVTLPL